MDNNDGKLQFDAWLNDSDFNAKIKEMEAKIKGFGANTDKTATEIESRFSLMAAGITGALTLTAAAQFRQQLIQVRGEFQKYEAVLANSLGSQEDAAESMQMLSDVASKTPFQLDSLTDSYVKLVNQGFKPSREEIIKLGDLASSTGKRFDQLAEAVLDAQTGQFERLKEFGIKASASGDQIAFSFKGVTTTVQNSGDAIRNYMLSLGDLDGVKGSMDAISKTLVGQVSNLEDSITAMFNEIGKSSEGFLSDSIGATKLLVDNYSEIGKAIGVLVTTYGTYKAAVIVTSIAQSAAASAVQGMTVAQQLNMLVTIQATKIQKLFNATMLVNPYAMAAAAIAGLAAGFVLYNTRLTEAQKLEKEHLEIRKKYTETLDQEKAKTDSLVSTLNNENLSKKTRLKALNDIKNAADGYLDGLTLENLKTSEGTKLLAVYNKEFERKIWLQANEEEKVNLIKEKRELEKQKNELSQQIIDLQAQKNNPALSGGSSFAPSTSQQTVETASAQALSKRTQLLEKQNALNVQLAKLNKEQADLEEASVNASGKTVKGYESVSDRIGYLDDQIKSLQKSRGELAVNDLQAINNIDKQINALKNQKEKLEKATPSKGVDVVKFDYTDSLAKSFAEGTSIIENETDKWNKIISEATQSELEEMVKVAQAESEVAQRKAELQAEALEQSRTLSEELSRIKTEYAAKEAALIASNAEFMPEKLEQLKKLEKEKIAAVVENATKTMEMGRLELVDFLANTAAKIEAMKAEGRSVEALQAQYDVAASTLEKIPSTDPFTAFIQAIKDYGEASEDVSRKQHLAAIFNSAAIAARELQGEVAGVVDILVDLGAINADQANSINNTAGQVAGLVQGAATIADGLLNLNPATIIKGGIEIVGNAIKLLSFKSKDIAKSQKAITEEIKNMESAYKRLDRSISSAVGGEVIELQLEKYKLNQKEMLKYDELIALERSKKKKKQNQDDIDAWNEAKESLKFDNEDIVASINLRLTNTTSESITDSIIQGFANGESSIADFADNFEDLMKNALLQALKVQALEGPIKQWYETFAGYLSDGILSPEENKKAKAAWDAIINNADKTWDALQEGTGMDFSANGQLAKANTLTGDIKGVTEETASIIGGQMNAIRMNQAESMEMIRGQLFHLANISSNTYNLHGMKTTLENIEKKISEKGTDISML